MNRDQVLDFLVSETEKWGQSLGGCDWTFIDGQYVHTIHDPITIDDWNRAKIKNYCSITVRSDAEVEYVEKLANESDWVEHYEIFYSPEGATFYFPSQQDYIHFFNVSIEMPKTQEQTSATGAVGRMVTLNIPAEEEMNINAKVLAEKVGSKYDQGKPRYELIPVHAEAEFVDVLTFGATKYGAENWRKVEDAKTRYQAALGRHIAAYRMGETHDIESGKHHLAHAMCCLAFIIELDLEYNQ